MNHFKSILFVAVVVAISSLLVHAWPTVTPITGSSDSNSITNHILKHNPKDKSAFTASDVHHLKFDNHHHTIRHLVPRGRGGRLSIIPDSNTNLLNKPLPESNTRQQATIRRLIQSHSTSPVTPHKSSFEIQSGGNTNRLVENDSIYNYCIKTTEWCVIKALRAPLTPLDELHEDEAARRRAIEQELIKENKEKEGAETSSWSDYLNGVKQQCFKTLDACVERAMGVPAEMMLKQDAPYWN